MACPSSGRGASPTTDWSGSVILLLRSGKTNTDWSLVMMCLQDSAFVQSLLSKGVGKQGVIWYYLCNRTPCKQKGNWGFSQLPCFQRRAKSTYIHLPYKQLNQLLKSTARRNSCTIYLFLFGRRTQTHFWRSTKVSAQQLLWTEQWGHEQNLLFKSQRL